MHYVFCLVSRAVYRVLCVVSFLSAVFQGLASCLLYSGTGDRKFQGLGYRGNRFGISLLVSIPHGSWLGRASIHLSALSNIGLLGGKKYFETKVRPGWRSFSAQTSVDYRSNNLLRRNDVRSRDVLRDFESHTTCSPGGRDVDLRVSGCERRDCNIRTGPSGQLR